MTWGIRRLGTWARETLHRLMAKHGGFRHNAQSLRVVEELELKYPEFNGLNLMWEVREGLHKPYIANRLVEGFVSPRWRRRRWTSRIRLRIFATTWTMVWSRG